MLPALQNSGRAKWGSARADRILKARVSDKNGISFAGSETLQISTAAPDFCFSRAQRLWDVICAIWDLLRCTEICKSAVIEFSAGREIYQQIFHRFFAESFLSSPNRLSGIWDLLSARSSIGTSEALGSLAVRGTPCPHGLRPMRCKICCGCEHGRLRGQCRECGGSSSFSASTGGSATAATARSVAAAASASTGGSAASARSVAAVASASTGARATTATVECGGSSICEHGRLCTTCMKECSGTAIHKHRRQRGLYEHRLLLRRQRSWCRIVAAAASFPWRRQRRKGSTGTRGTVRLWDPCAATSWIAS